MKKLILLLGLFCSIGGFSCIPEKCCAPPVMNGIRATRNGSGWAVYNAVGRIKQDTLILADTAVTPQQTDLLMFKLKLDDADNYTLTSANVIYAYMPQMDNPYVYYTPDASYANTLHIVDYEPGVGFIAGTFNIKFNKDPANTDNRYPATVTFLNGSFNVHLSK